MKRIYIALAGVLLFSPAAFSQCIYDNFLEKNLCCGAADDKGVLVQESLGSIFDCSSGNYRYCGNNGKFSSCLASGKSYYNIYHADYFDGTVIPSNTKIVKYSNSATNTSFWGWECADGFEYDMSLRICSKKINKSDPQCIGRGVGDACKLTNAKIATCQDVKTGKEIERRCVAHLCRLGAYMVHSANGTPQGWCSGTCPDNAKCYGGDRNFECVNGFAARVHDNYKKNECVLNSESSASQPNKCISKCEIVGRNMNCVLDCGEEDVYEARAPSLQSDKPVIEIAMEREDVIAPVAAPDEIVVMETHAIATTYPADDAEIVEVRETITVPADSVAHEYLPDAAGPAATDEPQTPSFLNRLGSKLVAWGDAAWDWTASGLVIAGYATADAAVWVYKYLAIAWHWTAWVANGIWTGLGEWIGGSWTTLGEWTDAFWNAVISGVACAWHCAANVVSGIWHGLGEWIGGSWITLGEWTDAFWNAVISGAHWVGDFTVKTWHRVF
ncbi:MAG: hypothetical protein LBO08_00730 [Rickettsiales bacterium]|jgi:hypothetical protein|nr:hypothetical protein [Rickettsiales bacterium]